MTDELTADALLAAVCAAPDDDLPRLAFADYLEESGDPAAVARAEFIRVQCEVARPDDHDERWLNRLLIREKALLAVHAQQWLAPLRRKGGPLFSRRTHGQFRRGFVEVVWMPAGWFLAKAERLFARCPVRELRLTQVTETDFIPLMRSEGVCRLEALDLTERRLNNLAAVVLGDTAHRWPTGKLKRVRLRGCGIDDDGADALYHIPAHFAPEELDLSWNPIGEAARQRLRARYGPAVRFT
jgi:uncharacterized protein (TIGR02996 family)